MSETLNIGDNAPFFEIETNLNGKLSLNDFSGKKLIIFFYPKDNTPGCTTEAKDFSEAHEKFKNAGIELLGVSKDSIRKHNNFSEKHDLSVNLGSDETGHMCEAFGVWVEKQNYGKKYMGIERSTFLLDENGKIQQIWKKVRVKGHVDAVFSEISVA